MVDMKVHYFSLLIVLVVFVPVACGAVAIQPHPAIGEGYSWYDETEVHLTSSGDYEFTDLDFPERLRIEVESSEVSIDGNNVDITYIKGQPDLHLRNIQFQRKLDSQIRIHTDDATVITECNTIESSNFASIETVHGTIQNSNFMAIETVHGDIENANFMTVETMHGTIKNSNYFIIKTTYGDIENVNFSIIETAHGIIENSNFLLAETVYGAIKNSNFFFIKTVHSTIEDSHFLFNKNKASEE